MTQSKVMRPLFANAVKCELEDVYKRQTKNSGLIDGRVNNQVRLK